MSRPTGAQHRGRMWPASLAFRRQLVLLRSLLPQSPPPSSPPSSVVGRRFAPLSSPSGTSGSLRAAHAMAAATVYEADAEAVVRRITPPLDRARHKGQASEPRPPVSVSSMLRGLCLSGSERACSADGFWAVVLLVRARSVFVGMPRRGRFVVEERWQTVCCAANSVGRLWGNFVDWMVLVPI